MICEKCGHDIQLSEWPFCPHGFGHSNVIGDEIPGGLVQENGFHEPRTFYSKRELQRALAEKGLEQRVRHVTLPGTDRSIHTTDWSKGSMDAHTLENARILVSRASEAKGRDVPEPDVPVTWAVTEQDV